MSIIIRKLMGEYHPYYRVEWKLQGQFGFYESTSLHSAVRGIFAQVQQLQNPLPGSKCGDFTKQFILLR
ncbi:MAG TPA: hypothetical protein VMS08_00445 [Candidatus Saccharimonadia bacterium]|nr:hypothetical protein [Candidatus Saccharimonadia bacterium]